MFGKQRGREVMKLVIVGDLPKNVTMKQATRGHVTKAMMINFILKFSCEKKAIDLIILGATMFTSTYLLSYPFSMIYTQQNQNPGRSIRFSLN